VKITNHLGLPEPIVRAVSNDSYSRGPSDISVTDLIAPPRQRALLAQHADEVSEDAADCIWRLLGSAVHEILHRAELEALAEHRLYLDVEGWTVSGAMDRFAFLPNGTLQDYKISSAWAVRDGGKDDWRAQLNLYALLLRHHGFTVDAAEVVVLIRDWRRAEALRYGPSYPQQQVAVIPIPLWEPDRAQAYLVERVRLHQAARVTLPLCTAEDRWQRPDVYAVMKAGRKSAVQLCDTEREATELAAADPRLSVVKRPGASVRCESYCAVAPFCRAVGDAQWTEASAPVTEEEHPPC
jgi:hypothetical protein